MGNCTQWNSAGKIVKPQQGPAANAVPLHLIHTELKTSHLKCGCWLACDACDDGLAGTDTFLMYTTPDVGGGLPPIAVCQLPIYPLTLTALPTAPQPDPTTPTGQQPYEYPPTTTA